MITIEKRIDLAWKLVFQFDFAEFQTGLINDDLAKTNCHKMNRINSRRLITLTVPFLALVAFSLTGCDLGTYETRAKAVTAPASDAPAEDDTAGEEDTDSQ